MTVVLVALAGAVGTLLRYTLDLLVVAAWPWTTLSINIVGSFGAGLLAERSLERLPDAVSTAMTVGLLGGFTTYSTFSAQTIALVEEGRLMAAGLYVAPACCLGCWRHGLGSASGSDSAADCLARPFKLAYYR